MLTVSLALSPARGTVHHCYGDKHDVESDLIDVFDPRELAYGTCCANYLHRLVKPP